MNITPLTLRLLFIGVLCLPSLCPAAVPTDGMQELIGHAYARESGEKLYTEHHYQAFEAGKIVQHRVEYRLPDGRPLATKTLDYAQHPFAPDFRLVDARDGYIEGGSHTDRGFRLERRLHEGEPLKTKLLSMPQKRELVADSGFDRYVRARLPALLETGSQIFELAVAGQLNSFAFEARLIEKSQVLGRPAAKISVRPASLLRLLTGGIDIAYDLETGYLLRYEGISNIRDENGDRYDARIDFPPADRTFNGS